MERDINLILEQYTRNPNSDLKARNFSIHEVIVDTFSFAKFRMTDEYLPLQAISMRNIIDKDLDLVVLKTEEFNRYIINQPKNNIYNLPSISPNNEYPYLAMFKRDNTPEIMSLEINEDEKEILMFFPVGNFHLNLGSSLDALKIPREQQKVLQTNIALVYQGLLERINYLGYPIEPGSITPSIHGTTLALPRPKISANFQYFDNQELSEWIEWTQKHKELLLSPDRHEPFRSSNVLSEEIVRSIADFSECQVRVERITFQKSTQRSQEELDIDAMITLIKESRKASQPNNTPIAQVDKRKNIAPTISELDAAQKMQRKRKPQKHRISSETQLKNQEEIKARREQRKRIKEERLKSKVANAEVRRYKKYKTEILKSPEILIPKSQRQNPALPLESSSPHEEIRPLITLNPIDRQNIIDVLTTNSPYDLLLSDILVYRHPIITYLELNNKGMDNDFAVTRAAKINPNLEKINYRIETFRGVGQAIIPTESGKLTEEQSYLIRSELFQRWLMLLNKNGLLAPLSEVKEIGNIKTTALTVKRPPNSDLNIDLLPNISNTTYYPNHIETPERSKLFFLTERENKVWNLLMEQDGYIDIDSLCARYPNEFKRHGEELNKEIHQINRIFETIGLTTENNPLLSTPTGAIGTYISGDPWLRSNFQEQIIETMRESENLEIFLWGRINRMKVEIICTDNFLNEEGNPYFTRRAQKPNFFPLLRIELLPEGYIKPIPLVLDISQAQAGLISEFIRTGGTPYNFKEYALKVKTGTKPEYGQLEDAYTKLIKMFANFGIEVEEGTGIITKGDKPEDKYVIFPNFII